MVHLRIVNCWKFSLLFLQIIIFFYFYCFKHFSSLFAFTGFFFSFNLSIFLFFKSFFSHLFFYFTTIFHLFLTYCYKPLITSINYFYNFFFVFKHSSSIFFSFSLLLLRSFLFFLALPLTLLLKIYFRFPILSFLLSICKSKLMLATLVEGDLKASFSIATTLRCRGERYSFPWVTPLYPWSIPYNVEC